MFLSFRFVQKVTGNSFSGDGIESTIINTLKLNQLSFQLKSLTLSLNPIAVSVQATLGILGLELDLAVYAGKVGGGFGLALVVSINQKHISEYVCSFDRVHFVCLCVCVPLLYDSCIPHSSSFVCRWLAVSHPGPFLAA